MFVYLWLVRAHKYNSSVFILGYYVSQYATLRNEKYNYYNVYIALLMHYNML